MCRARDFQLFFPFTMSTRQFSERHLDYSSRPMVDTGHALEARNFGDPFHAEW